MMWRRETQPLNESRLPVGDDAMHFAFGKNWESYAQLIDEGRVQAAERGLVRLVGEGFIENRTFLDIGCGSGVHSLAAARLGASQVVSIDIDPVAVSTTRKVLATDRGTDIRVERASVLELNPDLFGRFDIVYSWGALHHTGAMRQAISCAASVVSPGGLFVFAVYHRTRMCHFWTREKRWYSRSSPRLQKFAQAIYIALMRWHFLVAGKDFASFVTGYGTCRGMDFRHDVHDWLGGYPYESISPEDVGHLMGELGFSCVRSFILSPRIGLLGSGCDEYVYTPAG
jgi:SAM-dependent methyltransferase